MATAAAWAGFSPVSERQGLSGGDLRQREGRQFLRVNGQVVRGYRNVFFLGAIENIEGARIERRHAAAAEIIIHLRLDRLNRGGGGGGVRAGGQNGARVRLRLFHPTVEGGAGLEKLIRPFLVGARFAGTIGDRPHAFHDFANDLRHRRVVGALRHDDTVPVEQRGSKDAVRVHRLRQSHRRADGLAQMGQHAAGRRRGFVFRGR